MFLAVGQSRRFIVEVIKCGSIIEPIWEISITYHTLEWFCVQASVNGKLTSRTGCCMMEWLVESDNVNENVIAIDFSLMAGRERERRKDIKRAEKER